MPRLLPSIALAMALLAAGCRSQRYLQITSTPEGAEVRVDDELVGVTPVDVPFEHYGTRRVTFRLSGYRTTSKRVKLRPKWYARFPFDLVTEVLLPVGLTVRKKVHQDLVLGEEVMSLPSLRSVIERADALRHSGPEGPRDLPELAPTIVPGEAEPAETPAPDSQEPKSP